MATAAEANLLALDGMISLRHRPLVRASAPVGVRVAAMMIDPVTAEARPDG